jgi:spore coat polysaccharide biosynthesis protein SpsF
LKYAIYLSVRNKAKRFPGKVLKIVKGKTLTDHLISRLKHSSKVSQIVLCTSTNQDDDILVEIAKKNKIDFFRGSEDDKLDRYLNAAYKFSTDFIIVVDGDDVFCDPELIDLCVSEFERTGSDYVIVKDAPLGATPFCIKKEALEKVCKTKTVTNTEVWGTLFTERKDFKKSFVVPKKKLQRPEIRLTLDYKQDFELIEKIFNNLYQEDKIITLDDIVGFLTDNPKLLEINKDAQTLYEQHLKESQK